MDLLQMLLTKLQESRLREKWPLPSIILQTQFHKSCLPLTNFADKRKDRKNRSRYSYCTQNFYKFLLTVLLRCINIKYTNFVIMTDDKKKTVSFVHSELIAFLNTLHHT